MFTGPELNGSLLPGGSESWQIVLPDGTAFAEIRDTLQTDRGALLYAPQSSLRKVFTKLGIDSRRELTNALRGLNFEPAPL